MEIGKYNISNRVNKATNIIQEIESPYILNLSRKKVEEEKGGGASAILGGKIRFFSFKKIVILAVIFILAGTSFYGLNFYKKFTKIKDKALVVNAMSEEDLADLEQMIGLIRYLPDSGGVKKIKDLAADFESFKYILGFERPRKYLLVFQNPSEIRATGGFIGSVGVIDVESAKIKNIKFEDVYGLDGQLKSLSEPPQPIKKISAAWSLHDANWFFDFPTSAEKIAWFYEKGGGLTPDGVITISPEVVKGILRITGPIYLADYDQKIDEGSFVDLAQEEAEVNYDKTINQPKLFLADFLAEFKKTVEALPMDKKILVMKSVIANLDRKDIQLMFRGEGAEAFVESHGWGGQVNATDKDYLGVVHSSINGFKTDAMVKEDQSLVSEIKNDGSVENTLTIARVHTGSAGDADWYSRVNSDYLRVFVPKGSRLVLVSGVTNEELFLKDPNADYSNYIKDDTLMKIEQSRTLDPETGVDTFEEADKTVFGAWVYVSPGEKVTIVFKYILPFRIDFDQKTKTGFYSLLYQKQSGSKAVQLNQKIIYPSSWQVLGNYTDDFTQKNGEVNRTLDITRDRFASVLFLNK